MRFIVGAAAVAALFACPPVAPAHEAPSGWTYPKACCSNQDCEPLPKGAVVDTGEAWSVPATGQVIPYDAARPSPDGENHWCRVPVSGVLQIRCPDTVGEGRCCLWISAGG